MSAAGGSGPLPRTLLGLAAVAVAFAAADTYVVVLALPDMMTAANLDLDELQRAAPIVSGFLLGYVAILPLIGRIADLRGRVPVLIGSLVIFALGSVLTAAAYDLSSVVAGRLLQGVGGGGLVPATMALVADLWPPERRGVPLGVVGAVQELGSVLGPLYGALVLAASDWRAIFWLNTAVALVLVAAFLATRQESRPRPDTTGVDVIGAVLALSVIAVVVLVMRQPESLVSDVTYGRAFLPVVGGSRWLSPLAVAAAGLLILFVARQLTATRPLLAWRSWGSTLAAVDLPGAVLLGLSLGGLIVAFASADPAVQVLSPTGPYLLVASAGCAAVFTWRQARASRPLIPHGALNATSAWGALVVSLFVGAALIAALVDVPFYARLTVYPDSQLDAALVLLRFLAALPVGAVLGGFATRVISAGPLAAAGMAMAATGFVWMATWDADALRHASATVPLVAAGLGFGVAIAPVNAALLASTRAAVHGVTSALVVVARMVGMLVGISVLTTIGLRRFYAAASDIPPVRQLCPQDQLNCTVYGERLLDAGLVQLHTVFVGAAVCAAAAAVCALITLRPPADHRRVIAP
ncbi:MAG: MFS transporter [Nocardioidaceae bacterium]|nr:MFS transporter [Nocardioidaceae bacterium]